MSDETKNPVSKIRTFASDLELQRKNRKVIKEPEVKPVEKPIVESVPVDRNSFPKAMHFSEKPTIKAHIEKSVPVPPVPKEEAKRKEVPGPTLVLPKTETPTIGNKLPAFHELQKHVSHIENKPAPKPQVIKVPPKQPNKLNIGLDSTIITDNKRSQFKLFGSIIQSIKNWFKKSTKKKKNKSPQYAVPETIHRKGVIQKATSKSGTIYTADSSSIKEQIRRRQAEAELESIRKSQEPKEPETSWSPYTEPGYDLLEQKNQTNDVTSNVQVEFKKTATELPVVPPTPVAPEPVIEAPVIEAPVKKEIEPPLPRHEVESLIEKFKDRRKEKIEVKEPEKIMPEEVVPQKVQKEVPETRRFAPPRNNSFPSVNTNRVILFLLFAVIAVIILIVLSRVAIKYINFESTPEPVTTINLPESFINEAAVKTIILESDTLDLLPETIDSTLESSGEGISEIIIMAKSGDEVSPSYIFDLFEFKALPTLKQSLTSVRLLSVDGKEQMLLLKFVDEITVRGGLLYWEKTMIKDLQTIYDLPDKVEVDFTDETISGVDIRVLKNQQGVVILLYSIIDNNTAIISTDKADLLRILESEFTD